MASTSGSDGRHERAEDEDEDDERSGDAEVQLARLQVAVEDRVDVAVDGAVASDRHLEAARARLLHDLCEPAGAFLAVAPAGRQGSALRAGSAETSAVSPSAS